VARKSPKDSVRMREVIQESEDAILRRVRREALDAIRRLSPPVPLGPGAPSELWPGEYFDLGGWTLAQTKRKKPGKEGFA
jgi:hypothetical protein